MIATHVDSGVGPEKLLSALDSLRELACVYEFAGSITIANILAAIVTVISAEVRDTILSESPKLNLAARALVSIEMYLGYINSKLQPPATLIEVATAAVRDIGLDVSEFRTITHSDLLAKFEASASEDDGLDALLREIFELRPIIEDFHKDGATKGNGKINDYSAACLRLNAAAMIKGEKKFADLCRHASELAKMLPGRTDDASFNFKGAATTLTRTCETILRCMDDYSAKGKVNLFLVDAILELTTLTGYSQAKVEIQTARPIDTAAEPEMPSGYDPELQRLFNEEFAEQMAKLRDYLAKGELAVTDEECRAIHSIHGCSGSASCVAISTLFDVLEARFYALKGKDDSLTEQQAAALGKLLDSVEQYQSKFPWENGSDQLPDWLEVAGTLVGADQLAESAREIDAAGRQVEAVAATPLEADEEASEDPSSPILVLSDAPNVGRSVPETNDFTTVALTTAQPELDYNLEDYDLYVGDADEVIPELQRNITAWMADTSDREVTITIRRHMHTLKGSAGIIGASGIRTLTHHMESLFDSMASGAIKPDKNCIDLTTFVLNQLITMSDAVRNQAPYRSLPALNDFVQDSCELCRVDAEQLAAIISASYGTPTPAQSSEGAAPRLMEVSAVVAEPVSVVAQEEETQPEQELQATVELLHEPRAPESHSVPIVASDAVADQPEVIADNDHEPGSADEQAQTRRGYRGMRGRAIGERQRQFENRQATKSLADQGIVFDTDFFQGEPDYTEIQSPVREISPQVASLINKASESHREASRNQSKGRKGSEKIKVELAMLDNSVKLSNELKASSYRQTTLNRDMTLAVASLREKISLLLMHGNKTTVQLRHFNNITNSVSRTSGSEGGTDDERLYLERFNHLSHSHTQTLAQIEQLLQDANDILTQTSILDSAITYQGEVAASLQRDLLQSRLVMFDNEKPGLQGALGSALQFFQKKADLNIIGLETRIDRQLLESVRDSLRHVMTNAIAHGIESEEERIKLGKPASGLITVKASRKAKSLVIEVTDDGRGIDTHAIRQKAISRNLIKADDALTEQEILHLITEPGFSTAQAVTELAGRGVGMEIVRSRVSALGGHLHISSTLGVGTTIALELPITVGSNRALVCRISGQWFAIPTFNMTQVLDYPTTELLAIKAKPGQACISYDDKTYDVVHLADLMAVPDLKRSTAQAPSLTSLVLVEQGETRLAIEVENGVSMPEIHVTKFEGILSAVKGVIGSTEVHDGTPALVLDVIEMARLNLKMTDTGYKAKMYRIRRVKREAKPLVFVVDDASSYQKILTKHFISHGWDVATANNGHDALDKLPRIGVPSLFVVDCEMPRMDGLELTRRIRSLKQFDDTPIIMLTTRGNIKDLALEAGVTEFLPKPYDRATFTDAVRNVCPEIEAVGAA
ncbi:response regulator [Pseudomonas syringae pv. actinidiae]|nr:response regulator [Pseudomonas syringae pv. actinidiae]